MHPDDLDELSELGFGFAWPAIAELFREAHDEVPVPARPDVPRSSHRELARTTHCSLPNDWTARRSN